MRWLTILATLLSVSDTPDLAGTWRLDEERSRFTAEDFLPGLSGAGPPETILVTQPANGTLVIESLVRQSHARLFRPGGTATTFILVGEAGKIETESTWSGASLESVGTIAFDAGGSIATKETIGLSSDGNTLEIDVAVGDRTSSFAYTRIDSIGPCETWPMPCSEPTPAREP